MLIIDLEILEVFELEDALDKIGDEQLIAFLDEETQRVNEMIHEGEEESFDPHDFIGRACDALNKIKNGNKVDLLLAV